VASTISITAWQEVQLACLRTVPQMTALSEVWFAGRTSFRKVLSDLRVL
jgi:hypothetical protein